MDTQNDGPQGGRYSIPRTRALVFREIEALDKPGARLAKLGPEALSDLELLTMLVAHKPDDQAAADAARVALAAGFPHNAEGWAEARKDAAVKRYAPALAVVRELARRFQSNDARPVLDSPARALEHIPAAVRSARKEHLLAFYLNARSQLVHLETVSVGTLSASLVHPREVFGPAIAHSAAALIVAHNHPSGDCSPSAEDKDATRRLARAGELLGVPLLDHLIVSERGFFSFKEHGLLGAL